LYFSDLLHDSFPGTCNGMIVHWYCQLEQEKRNESWTFWIFFLFHTCNLLLYVEGSFDVKDVKDAANVEVEAPHC